MHADVRIIAAGFGGSDEQQQGVFTSLLVRVFDECFTDALFLEDSIGNFYLITIVVRLNNVGSCLEKHGPT